MKRVLLFLLIVLSSYLTHSNNYLDSLNTLYNSSIKKETSNGFTEVLMNLSQYYIQHDIEKARSYSKEGLAISKIYNDEILNYKFCNQTAITFAIIGNNDSAAYYFSQFLKLDTSRLSDKNLGSAYNNLGILYSNTGDFEKSLKNHLIGLKYREAAKDTGEIAASMNNIGLIFYREKKLEKAVKYFKSTIKLLKNNNSYYDNYAKLMLNAHNNLGLTYSAQNQISRAIKEYQISLKIGKENDLEYNNAYTLQYLGESLLTIKEYDKALRKFKESLRITKKIGDQYGENLAVKNIAQINYENKNYKEAIEMLENVSHYYKQIGDRSQELQTYYDLSQNYYGNKQFQFAYDNLMLSYSLKDSIFNKDTEKALAEMETKYQTVKKEAEIIELNKTKEIQKEKLKAEKKQRIALIGGLLLLLGLSISIYRSYTLKKKSNIEIEAQRDEANKQKALVEEKNKDILESISYAKRIQEAILPQSIEIKKYLKNHFIYYKPKDIVSGDFYWFYPINENEILIAAVDCTGHGVPGAFMSIIGNNGLNKAVQESNLKTPSLILNYLNDFVIKSLKQNSTHINDGMDISLCHINVKTNQLQYSGAHNPLIIIRKNEIIETKANRYSIGSKENNFSNHAFKLEENDSIYIYSDGFADQFGGDKGKKFSSKKLKELLKSTSSKTTQEQYNIIDSTFNEWTKNEEQLDDICIIGIKI